MVGIRIGNETTMICLNPRFVMNGRKEGLTLPFGAGYGNLERVLCGSFGVAYSNSGGHTLWFHWKNVCSPRDWDSFKQWAARVKKHAKG